MRTYQCNIISNLNKWLRRKSIIEHAKAWLAEDRKLVGDDPIALIERAKAA